MIACRLVDDPESIWPVIASYFARIPEKVTTEVTPDSIRAAVDEGRLDIWAICDEETTYGFLAAGLRQCGAERVAFIEAIAGDEMERWLGEALASFETLAREAGATIVEHEGRKGWERVLPGYRVVRVVLQKRL